MKTNACQGFQKNLSLELLSGSHKAFTKIIFENG